MPVIRLRDDVYSRLRELKKRLGHSSFNETVAWLLERATSPQAFLESAVFFFEDMRRDVKELKQLLRELVDAIRVVRG